MSSDSAGDSSDVDAVDSVNGPQGQFTLRLHNHLPVTIADCSLMIGATARSDQESSDSNFRALNVSGGRMQAQSGTPPGMIDVYHTTSLGHLSAGRTVEQSFTADFQVKYRPWDMTVSVQNGRTTFPRISRLGTATAWIIGRLEESPILTIDEQQTQFTPREELHLFIQQILPADMPNISVSQASPN